VPIKLVSEDEEGRIFRQIQSSPSRVLTPNAGVSYSGKQLTTGPAIAMFVDDEAAAQAVEAELGRPLDAVVAFTDHTNVDIAENTFPFETQWPGDRKLILSHCLSVDGWDMDEAGDGTHDADYQEAVDNLVPYRDRIFSLRIGWEFNATGGFPWAIGGAGTNQSAANYVLAFNRFARMVREAMPEVLIDWCPLWDQADPDPWYPGDDVVDIIGNDVYLKQAFWTDQFYDALFNTDAGLTWQESFAQTHGKLMAIAEFGSDFNTGTWVTSMLKWMQRPRAARVLYHGYWNSAQSFDSSFETYPVNAAAYYAACNDKTVSLPR
jgi:hypothetical protein